MFTYPLNTNQLYTFQDYLSWNDGKRYELYEGVVYEMQPATTARHQRISTTLSGIYYYYLRTKKCCQVFNAPIDVHLDTGNGTDTVVQPDIIVVCDPSKIDEDGGCNGAPDLIVEVLSPSTAKHDLRDKFFLYQKAGVKEYWVIYPGEKILNVFKLENNLYGIPTIYSYEDKVKVGIFEDLIIDLKEVFNKTTD